jgi:hypothetical protein
MEPKLKHLDIIQITINRMASNSFLFKGWSVAISSSLLFAANHYSNIYLYLIPIVATIQFWVIDAYYLSLERGYTSMYEKVAKMKNENIDFSMALPKKARKVNWAKAMISNSLWLFYGVTLILIIITIFLRKRGN